MNREYHARVHQEDGSFWAEVVELPGCFAAGDDLQELQQSLTEAMRLVLDEEVNIEFGEPTATERTEDRDLLVSC